MIAKPTTQSVFNPKYNSAVSALRDKWPLIWSKRNYGGFLKEIGSTTGQAVCKI